MFVVLAIVKWNVCVRCMMNRMHVCKQRHKIINFDLHMSINIVDLSSKELSNVLECMEASYPVFNLVYLLLNLSFNGLEFTDIRM
jgi:hypothetical protein